MSRRDRSRGRGRDDRNESIETGSVAPSVGAASIVSFFTANSAGSGGTSRGDRRTNQLRDEADVALIPPVDRLHRELEREQCQRKKDAAVYDMELKKLKGQKAAAEKRNDILMRDMDDRNAISHYATLIKKAAPQAIDSTYVLKLQSQLAKAMHRMGVLENQVVLAEQACEGVVKNLEKEVEKVIDRTSRAEREHAEQVKKIKSDARRYRGEAARLKEGNSKAEVNFLSQIMKLEDENHALRKTIDSHRSDGDDGRMDRRDGRETDGLQADFGGFTSESSENDRSRKVGERTNE